MNTTPPVRPPVHVPGIGESLARPKVLRRPAQFSKSYTPTKLPVPAVANLASPEALPAIPTTRLWQDDGRFALTLLLLLVLINLAVTGWLAAMPPTVAEAPVIARTGSGTDIPDPASTIVHILNEPGTTELDR